ncbi:MAG: flagellar basal-body rod protein FlgG [Rhodospirillaceae bacterium]|nr:flagellar basal-body rod protein FlgG [Rhodospirillaceae bacterium]
MKSLSIAATGMGTQQRNVAVITNNLANVNTTAFKTQHALFADLMYQNYRVVGQPTSDSGTIRPTGLQIGLGSQVNGSYRIFTSGALQQTDNSYDVAVNGRGFFEVEMPDGSVAYTRSGTFAVNGDGEMVTSEGYRLSGINGTISPNALSVTISETGEVWQELSGEEDLEQVGQLNLSLFQNENGLEALGRNYFRQTSASGQAQSDVAGTEGRGVLLQGYLERSNVDTVAEITNLIEAQRAYELNSKALTRSDEMLRTAVNILN